MNNRTLERILVILKESFVIFVKNYSMDNFFDGLVGRLKISDGDLKSWNFLGESRKIHLKVLILSFFI